MPKKGVIFYFFSCRLPGGEVSLGEGGYFVYDGGHAIGITTNTSEISQPDARREVSGVRVVIIESITGYHYGFSVQTDLCSDVSRLKMREENTLKVKMETFLKWANRILEKVTNRNMV